MGRISAEKSLDVVVRAFAKVQRWRRRAKLILVGDGPKLEELKQLSKELGIEKSVVFLGYIAHEQLIADNILLLGDIFVTASKTENQPMSILEAMSFGLPIIGANAKGIPELISDGQNGMLFEADNVDAMAQSMLRLAAKRRRRKRMGRAAYVTATEYTLNRVVDRLEQVYVDAIDRKKTKR